jgi:hypothetical protein
MRHFMLAFILATSACATTGNTGANHPTNVAHVRLAIWEQMQTQAPQRTITAMGKTTDERAVVYTKSNTGSRQEETWVKDGSGWRLDHAVAADGAASAEGQL